MFCWLFFIYIWVAAVAAEPSAALLTWCGVLVYLQKGEESRLDAVRKHVLSADERAALDALVPETKIDVINQPKPEFRDFGLGAQIVADCGVTRMHVLSESKRQLVGLDAYGLEVIDRIDIPRPRYAR